MLVGRFRCVALARSEARPAVIFASTKSTDALLKALELGGARQSAAATASVSQAYSQQTRPTQQTRSYEQSYEQSQPPSEEDAGDGAVVHTLPAAYFAYEDALAVLERLHVAVDDPTCDADAEQDLYGPDGGKQRRWRGGGSGGGGNIGFGRLQRARALMDVGQQAQVRAAGALLLALERAPDSPARRAVLMSDDSTDGGGFQAQRAAPPLMVARVREISFRGIAYVDVGALTALQIFADDAHPSVMGIGTKKEGFSLFSLLDRCMTRAGRAALRRWLLAPLASANAIAERQRAVQCFIDDDVLHEEAGHALKALQNVPKLLLRMATHGAATSETDWMLLGRSIDSMSAVRAILGPRAATAQRRATAEAIDSDEAAKAAAALAYRATCEIDTRALQSVARLILSTIDIELPTAGIATAQGGGGGASPTSKAPPRVRHGVCPELDELRQLSAQLPEAMAVVTAREIRQRVPERLARAAVELHDASVEYLPQVGFAVCLSKPLSTQLSEYLPDYEFAFASGPVSSEDLAQAASVGTATRVAAAAASAGLTRSGMTSTVLTGDSVGISRRGDEGPLPCLFFYSSDRTKQFDEEYGDVAHQAGDLETALLSDLSKRIAVYSPALCRAAAFCAELDALRSLGTVAIERSYVRPECVDEPGTLTIEAGRHPLQELAVGGAGHAFVPNGVDCSTHKVHVVIGPNYSGKSVYARQCALIAYMASVGSYVPAARATVGAFDRVMVRACSRRGATDPRGSSTFAADLEQVSAMLRHATPRSLLLIDEFGKGTAFSDGAGLLSATLSALTHGDGPLAVGAHPLGGARSDTTNSGDRGITDGGYSSLAAHSWASGAPSSSGGRALALTFRRASGGASGTAAMTPENVVSTPAGGPRASLLREHKRQRTSQPPTPIAGFLASGASDGGARPSCWTPPITFCCTHFTELLQPHARPASPHVGFCRMEVHVDAPQAEAVDRVVYLYRVVGIALEDAAGLSMSSSSFGLLCARNAGVPGAVVDRAAEVMRAYAKGEPVRAARDAAGDPGDGGAVSDQGASAAAAAASAALVAADVLVDSFRAAHPDGGGEDDMNELEKTWGRLLQVIV